VPNPSETLRLLNFLIDESLLVVRETFSGWLYGGMNGERNAHGGLDRNLGCGRGS